MKSNIGFSLKKKIGKFDYMKTEANNQSPKKVTDSHVVLSTSIGGAILGNMLIPGIGGVLLGGVLGGLLGTKTQIKHEDKSGDAKH